MINSSRPSGASKRVSSGDIAVQLMNGEVAKEAGISVKHPANQKVKCSVYIPQHIKENIDQLLEERGMSFSSYALGLITKDLEKKGLLK
ncbi:MAG: hypothetical protein HUJ80_03855 [Firmicutes bacterium]|nr:hypothetical protein [Bacillota bacterium]